MATSKIKNSNFQVYRKHSDAFNNVKLVEEYRSITLNSMGAYNTGITTGNFISANLESTNYYVSVRSDSTLEYAVLVVRRLDDNSFVSDTTVNAKLFYLES